MAVNNAPVSPISSLEEGMMIPIGDRNTMVKVTEWNNRLLIHIRKFMYDDDKERLYPTKIGIALNEKELEDILEKGGVIREKIKLCKCKSKNE